jgi:hypothetical protein
VDAVAKDGIVVACVISGTHFTCFTGTKVQMLTLRTRIPEHVENAGVHSGDATIVSPAQVC